MENDYKKYIEEILKLLPDNIVPESYIEYLFLDNEDVCDGKDELMSTVKMQLSEETGLDIPLTRKEAEEYLLEDLNDAMWEDVNENSMISSRQVKQLEDYDEKSVFEILKEMPLIPASRVISSIMASYMSSHGLEITPQRQADMSEDMIHLLGSTFSEIFLKDEDDDDDDDDYEDFDLEFEDGFDPEEDWDSDIAGITGEEDPDNPAPRKNRRSRITRFPGKK